MLAKVAPLSNDFHALARYLVRGKPGTTPDPRRVAWILTQNLPSDDPDLAATYMAATAQNSSRTKNATYHLMIAWQEQETPSADLMQTVALRSLELAGLVEHQALIMGHGDKPHPHLHILLNRIHPETGRAWKTAHDFARWDRIMKQLAADHGCEYVPAHLFNPDLTEALPKKPNSAATHAGKRGARTVRPQMSRQDAGALGDDLSTQLDQASTSDDLRQLLEDRGLAIEAKGQGHVIGNSDTYAKLSSLRLTSAARTLAIALASVKPSLPKPPCRNVFTVDGVDIVRGLLAFGLTDRDDVKRAIDDATRERAAMKGALLATQQKGPLATTVLSSRPVKLAATGRRPAVVEEQDRSKG